MRRTLLALMIALALLAAPVAFAKGGQDDDHDDDDDAPRADKARAERNHTSDKANRTADRLAFSLFVDDWHDNATKIRDDCHALKEGNNTTDVKRCVRDGYRAWWKANWGIFAALKWLNGKGHRGHHD